MTRQTRTPPSGPQHATIADVAKLAKVSKATVSRAMRDFPHVRPELRERVLQAARQLNYVADPNASRLASGKTRTVGLIATQLTTWYVSQLSAGIEDVLHPAGNDLLVSALSTPKRRQEVRDGQTQFRQRVDAAILVDVFVGKGWAPPPGDPPAIVIGERLNSGQSLGIDDVLGGFLAGQHLVAHGHRKITLIAGSSVTARFSPVVRYRAEGLQRAISGKGVEILGEVDGAFTIEGGYHAAMEILSRHPRQRPTAVFCFSDEMAFGALQACRELGLGVGSDISVVGFDDHSVAEAVGLTTIRQPVRLLGQRAAERALGAISGTTDHVHQVLPIELVERSSSGPAHRR
jgi:LacI family transcriptional regulator, repressor for deo operon, udp, cdd, tsx, nupC, and nupG